MITAGAAQREGFFVSARDALLQVALPSPPHEIFDAQAQCYVPYKPARRSASGLANLQQLGRACLVEAGVDAATALNVEPFVLGKLMMGIDPQQLGSPIAADAAYNASGMFSNIVLDAANVSARHSFDQVRTTFQLWMKRGEDIPNFLDANRVVAGEFADPRAIPENGEFEETTLADGKEKYRLTVWGRSFSYGFQLFMNTGGSAGALLQPAMKLTAAMKRKMNRLAYQELKDNAALSDNTALFHADHNNLSSGVLTTAADYAQAWGSMAAKMREQHGLSDESGTLNIPPRFVVYPPKQRDPILTALHSRSVVVSSQGNAGTTNIWQGEMEPVEEAELAASAGGSDTAHYLAADTVEIDTIEYAFLQGMPAPVVEQRTSFERLAIRQRVYFAFGTKPLEFRGLQMHTGAA
jgi:hypothetical protein